MAVLRKEEGDVRVLVCRLAGWLAETSRDADERMMGRRTRFLPGKSGDGEKDARGGERCGYTREEIGRSSKQDGGIILGGRSEVGGGSRRYSKHRGFLAACVCCAAADESRTLSRERMRRDMTEIDYGALFLRS